MTFEAAHRVAGKPSYVHQGWLTTDHKYFLLDDETDELDGFPYEMGYAPDKRLSIEIFDMTDLDAPFLIGYDVKDYDGYNHNIFTKGELVIRADYEHGIQFEDQNGAAMGKLDKLGFFDTDPPYGEDHPGVPVFTPCTGKLPFTPCTLRKKCQSVVEDPEGLSEHHPLRRTVKHEPNAFGEQRKDSHSEARLERNP